MSATPTNQIGKEGNKRVRFVIKLITFMAIIFAIAAFQDELIAFGTPSNLLQAITFYLTANLVISFLRLVIVFSYLRKHKLQRSMKNNFVLGINHIANILMVVASIGAGLMLVNIDPLKLITSLSIVAAAIAVLSKDYISNMINGMIIMFSDELSLGDHIKIGDIKGKIADITLTNLHLVNDDEDLIYIPNSIVFTSQVINYTKRSVRKVSFDFDVKNDKLHSIETLEEELIASVSSFHKFIKPESFNLRIIKINENFTSLKFQFILQRQSTVQERDIRKVMMRKVLKYLNK